MISSKDTIIAVFCCWGDRALAPNKWIGGWRWLGLGGEAQYRIVTGRGAHLHSSTTSVMEAGNFKELVDIRPPRY